MPKNGLNVSLNSYDDIFSTEETRQEEQREQVQQIPIDELYPFKDHPFKVLDDEAMQRTVESIKQLGVTNPLIARSRPDGGYEIISGHRRQHAAQLARLKTLPVIVRDMSDDAAVLLMVDSNLQREQILPSERAFAYKMKLDALKRQGARSDLTSSQVGMKLQALDIVGQEAGDSRNQVHRFIRLTNLIPELLDMVDEKKISFNPAVELSYLDESQQRDFLEAMADTQNAPSLSQAQRLKKLAQEGHFSYDVAFAVMGEPKKDELDKVVIKNDTLRKYFPESSTPREMEEKIIGLLEESKTEKVVFRSDSIKKYFPSNYSSEQIENSILKIHVRCLIDEAANIGQIPNLEKLVATIRSREISACLVLQAKSQLKAIYKDNADTIIGNMDSQIFLGGSEPGTLKDLSEMLGKETIDSFNTSDTRGNSPSYGTSFQKLGHELLSRDEIAVLDGGKCILQLRGVRPFLSDKYDLTQHPNYKLTSDYDPKNTFDIEKYLNRKEKIHPGDEFIVVDADSLPSA